MRYRRLGFALKHCRPNVAIQIVISHWFHAAPVRRLLRRRNAQERELNPRRQHHAVAATRLIVMPMCRDGSPYNLHTHARYGRHATRPIRDRRASGRRRDGSGLQGPRHAARPRCGPQGAAGGPGRRPRTAAPVRARSADDRRAQPSAHRRTLRRRPGGRHVLRRHRTAVRHDAAPTAGARAATRSGAQSRSPRRWRRASRPRMRTARFTAT